MQTITTTDTLTTAHTTSIFEEPTRRRRDTKKRQDVHTPVNFRPEDYEPFRVFDWKDNDDFNWLMNTKEGLALEQKFRDAYEAYRLHWGTMHHCDHCGSRLRYVGIFFHKPSGDYVAIGERCADRMQLTTAEFQARRKQSKRAADAAFNLQAWQEFKEENEADWAALEASQNEFIQNVIAQGKNRGVITGKQLAAIIRSLEAERAAAEEEVIELPTVDVVVGNGIKVTGTVIGLKTVYTDWGDTQKMLIEVNTGEGVYKLWGTEPSSISPYRGDVVEFVANVSESKDKGFGFFARPRKASIIKEAEA